MNRTYRLSDVVNERFLRLPLSLFANPNYKRLSAESKLVYSLLLDRMSLSQKNNWINEDGEVYLIYKREEIADILCITYKKAIAAFKELITAGLLLEKRQGRGFPNRRRRCVGLICRIRIFRRCWRSVSVRTSFVRAEIILKKFCFKVCRGTPQAGGRVHRLQNGKGRE